MNTPPNHANEPSLLELWYNGGLDLTDHLYIPVEETAEPAEKYRPKHNDAVFARHLYRYARVFNVAGTVLCILFSLLMILTVANLPAYGDPNAPTVNEVAERYVEQGTAETGAVNTVAGMILDYRAFDTLGESFVLFTAVAAVTVVMERKPKKRYRRPELVIYAEDDIVRVVCRFLIPVVLVFGVYILLNGHLSPGGGFSGGAIMAGAPILYAMVWGDEQAAKVFTARRIRTVVVSSLGFYCAAKSYSFFTGANHLPSIISPGTPGNILSAGLIMPLNVAVGLVVCCTMYSFYMYFRRGAI